MPYTSERPRTPPRAELEARIPGWGVDLDPAHRPSYPKMDISRKLARWDFPERQPELMPRERSPEHAMLTPVFGTTCPTKGLSGAIRRAAYRLSEGRATHWLMLIAADRIDVMESRLTGLALGKPDNPITESGIMAEKHYHGIEARRGHRADVVHHPADFAMMVAPYALLGFLAYKLARRQFA